MPFYEYHCTDGHVTDHLHRFSDGDRPDHIDCPVPNCGLPSWYRVAAPQVGGPEGKRKLVDPTEGSFVVRITGDSHGIRCAELRCTACNHDYFDALSAGEAIPACPKCGAEGKEKAGFPSAEGMKAYPRFDRGLGCVINSPAHRAAICKERGLIPVDGDWDIDAYLRKEHEKADAHNKAYAEYCDKLDNAPEFASLREAQDKGLHP